MPALARRLGATVPALLAAALALGTTATAHADPAATTTSTSSAHEVIVTGAAAAVRGARALVPHGATYRDLPVIGGFADRLTAQQAAQLTARGLKVADDSRVKLTDADWGEDSHDASAVYPQVDGAPSAWAQGINGSGVSVAVIDTGINATGDLAGKVIDGYDFSGEDNYRQDSFGHGTFVAGIIAGSGAASNKAVEGVAPGVNLVSLKVAGADGSTDVVRVVSAIQWAVNHAAADHIRVINLSLGTDSTQNWKVDPLDAAVEGAWRAGLVVTVAAGNEGSAGISDPGNDPYVVTVGSTDDATTVATGDDLIAPFSSTGPTADGVAKPDLVTPGEHIVSTRAVGSTVDTTYPSARVQDAYFRGSGTSFSTPQVSAAAALLLQQRPWLTNDQVKGQLIQTADAISGVPTTAQGAGELDIKALLSSPTAPPANTGLGRSDGSGSPFKSEGSLGRYGSLPTGGDSAAWNSAAWNSAAWNSAAWNSAAWNSAAWNSAAWNSAAWNSAAWNSAAWNSAAWNASGWAAAGFWSAAWN